MNKKEMIVVIIVAIILIIIGMFIFNKVKDEKKEDEKVISLTNDFNTNIIKASFEENNYLISPYSIEVALNMLKEGSENNTKRELENVLSNRKNNDIRSNEVHIANALFVKNIYQNKVLNSYYSTLKNNYKAEIVYDEFISPDVINNWVKRNTNDMIPKILDSIDDTFVLGLANAIALDVKWQSKFECNLTTKEIFTKKDNTKIDVSMMHQSFRSNLYKYIKEKDLEGIVIPYQSSENISLEFVGLIPNNISDFIKKMDKNVLENIDLKSKNIDSKTKVNVSLPRFSYEYEIKDFIKVLKSLGINDLFDSSKADLSSIIKREDMNGNLYVDEAIHKTKIELNENGTKAAAITYFGMKNTAILEDKIENIDIMFNKPFIYMIRDGKTKEILFFGSVFEPEVWTKTTCENY